MTEVTRWTPAVRRRWEALQSGRGVIGTVRRCSERLAVRRVASYASSSALAQAWEACTDRREFGVLVRAIAQRGDVGDAPLVIDGLGTAYPEVRGECLRALSLLGAQEALPHVRAALDDPEVGYDAIASLGALGDRDRDAEVLLGLLKHRDPGVVGSAGHALAVMGGGDWFDDLERARERVGPDGSAGRTLGTALEELQFDRRRPRRALFRRDLLVEALPGVVSEVRVTVSRPEPGWLGWWVCAGRIRSGVSALRCVPLKATGLDPLDCVLQAIEYLDSEIANTAFPQDGLLWWPPPALKDGWTPPPGARWEGLGV